MSERLPSKPKGGLLRISQKLGTKLRSKLGNGSQAATPTSAVSTSSLADAGQSPAPLPPPAPPEVQVQPHAAPDLPPLVNTTINDNTVNNHGQNFVALFPLDLWTLAYEQADAETREWIKTATRSSHANIEDIKTLVERKEDDYKNETPKYTLRSGKEIIWRDYATRVVSWVTVIGDTAAPFVPAPGSTVWTAMKFLLKAHTSQCEDVIAIFGCAEQVLRVVRQGQVYQKVYSLDVNAEEAGSSTTELRKCLVDLFSESLNILALAGRRLGEGLGKQFLQALTDPMKGEKANIKLLKLQNQVSHAAQACEAELRQVMGAEHKALLESLNLPLCHVREGVKELLVNIEADKKNKVLNDISSIRVNDEHYERNKKRASGTGDWIFQLQSFIEWEESSTSSILWLRGQMGVGKSVLTSRVIDRYKDSTSNGDEGFAFFYCDRNIPDRTDSLSVLRSLVVQLASTARNETRIIKALHDHSQGPIATQPSLGIPDCEKILSDQINLYPRCIIILDGLDECDENSRGGLLDFFSSMVRDAKKPLKIFISGRPEIDISGHQGMGNLVEVDATKNEVDIRIYIDRQLKLIREKQSKHGCIWSKELQNEIGKKLLDKSGGMFRWVELQWRQLEDTKSPPAVRKRLDSLPKTLTDAYTELYDSQTDHDRVILQRAVQWVWNAKNPPSSEELLSAIRLSYETDESDTPTLRIDTCDDVVPEVGLESICRHLIIRVPETSRWRFPHASVTEFFENKHASWFSTSDVNVTVSLTLLETSLLYGDGVEQSSDKDDYTNTQVGPSKLLYDRPSLTDNKKPFRHLVPGALWSHYIPKIYKKHAEKRDVPPVMTKALHRLFMDDKSPLFSARHSYDLPRWVLHFDPISHSESHAESWTWIPRSTITFICVLGLYDLLKLWHLRNPHIHFPTLESSCRIDMRASFISIAASEGHYEICEDLITLGCNMSDSEVGYALTDAIFQRRADILELLLRGGASPSCRYDGLTCLEMAAKHLTSDCMSILIQHGASFEDSMENGQYSHPLIAAIRDFNSLPMVKYMFEQLKVGHEHLLFRPLRWPGSGSPKPHLLISTDMMNYLVQEQKMDPEDLARQGVKAAGFDSWFRALWKEVVY